MNSGFFRADSSDLSPGDTIVVPLKADKFEGLNSTLAITNIVYQMALAAAAVNSF